MKDKCCRKVFKSAGKSLLCVILLLSLLLSLTACGNNGKETGTVPELLEPAAAKAATVTVERADLYNITEIPVTIVPKRDKLYFTTEGTVDQILAVPGEMVEAGQPLIKLDTTSLERQISDLETQISYTQTQYSYAITAASYRIDKAVLEQTKAGEELLKAQDIYAKAQESQMESSEALTKAKDRVETAEKDLETAKAALEEAKSELAKAETALEQAKLQPQEEETENTGDGTDENEGSSSTDPSPDEVLKAAQDQYDACVKKAEEAQEKLEKAEKELTDAKDALKKLEDELDEAETVDLEVLERAASDAAYEKELADVRVRRAELNRSQLYQTQGSVISSMRSQLSRLQEKMDAMTLTAPYAGRIVGLYVIEREYIREYETIIVIADESVIEIEGQPFSNDRLIVAGKMDAMIDGIVYQIEYVPYDPDDYLKRSLRGEKMNSRFTLAASETKELTFGQSGTVRIYYGSSVNALCLPKACIMSDEMGAFVYVDEEGQRIKRYVSLGIETVTSIEIKDGVKEGEVVYVGE